ncbi:Cell adhesion molecule 2 [Holothuria leucospilota]|uniref:Cell adhesion molecule 2 n=1 Tax=Holothuria leucospilota TaxID=206669 RepID=A0A9Q1H1H1_HOLLE|nr:Cell adhesion molecule 2 [Holothuria leucospilota]
MVILAWFLTCVGSLILSRATASTLTSDGGEVQTMSTLEGERVTLSCRIDYSGTENMNAHMALWRKLDTVPVNFNENSTEQLPRQLEHRVTVVNDHKHQGRFMLIINDVSVNDSGIYQCYILRLPDLAVSVLSSVNLVVMVPPKSGYPKCKILSGVSQLSVGHPFTVKCTSRGGIPSSRLRWYLNGDPISEVGHDSVSVHRVFNTKDFNATYVCREENEALHSIRECTVTPKTSTFWIKVAQSSPIFEKDGKVRVTCGIQGNSKDSVRYDWFLNGMKVGISTTKRASDAVNVIVKETERNSYICCKVTLAGESVTNCTQLSTIMQHSPGTDRAGTDDSFEEIDYTQFLEETQDHHDGSVSPYLTIAAASSLAIVVGVVIGAAVVFVMVQGYNSNFNSRSLNLFSKTKKQRRTLSTATKPESLPSFRSQTIGPNFSLKRPTISARPLSRAWTFDTRCLTVNNILDDLSFLRSNVASISSTEGNVTDETVVNTSSSDNPNSDCYVPLRPESISSSKYEGLSSVDISVREQSYAIPPSSADESVAYEDVLSRDTDSWCSETDAGTNVSSAAFSDMEPFYHNNSVRSAHSGSILSTSNSARSSTQGRKLLKMDKVLFKEF